LLESLQCKYSFVLLLVFKTVILRSHVFRNELTLDLILSRRSTSSW